MISYGLYLSIYTFIAVASILSCYVRITPAAISQGRRNQQDIFIIFYAALLMGIFASIRPIEDSHDTFAYYKAYSYGLGAEGLSMLRFGARFHNMEVLFLLFMNFLKQVGLSFRGVLFVFGFLNAWLLLTAAKSIAEECTGRPINVKRLIAVFMCSDAYYCFIMIRGGIGMGLALFGASCLLKREWARGAVFFSAGCLMHSTTILMVIPLGVLMFCTRRKFIVSRKLLLTILLACVTSLMTNGGRFLINSTMAELGRLIEQFSVDGFGGYFEIDTNVGYSDWLIVSNSSIIVYILSRPKNGLRNLCAAVCFGISVMSFLYPIRSISRAAGFGFIFLLPLMASADMRRVTKLQRFYLRFAANFLFLLNSSKVYIRMLADIL